MSRIILRGMLSLIAAFLGLAVTAMAQPSYGDLLCYPDCPADQWSTVGVSNHMFTLTTCGSSCQLRAWYVYRTACAPSNYQDVQIYKIEYVSGTCTSCSISDWIQGAAEHLLVDNISLFPNPDPDNCVTYFRVSIASCWKEVKVGSVPSIRACQSAGCCVARYKVCKGTDDRITITTEYQSPTQPPCDNDPESLDLNFPYNPVIGDQTTSSCTPQCDAITINDSFGKKYWGGQYNITDDVQVFHQGAEMQILCRPQSLLEGVAEIFDAQGKKVAELRPVIVGDNACRFLVDRIRFGSGIYYYRISFNGQNFTTGEFFGR